MNKTVSQEYVNAFVDGELTADERERAYQRLEHDPVFKGEACDVRTLKEMVKGAYTDLPVPRHARRATDRWRGVRQAMVAGLLLFLGVGMGWLMREQADQPMGYPRMAGLLAGYKPVALARKVDPDKLVLHVDTGDVAVFDRALKLAESLLAHNPDRRQVEIVVHSSGLDMLREDITPYRERINQLAQKHTNMAFVACGNTVARFRREGKHVVLVPEAKVVPSAVGEIINRMQNGWVYIKV